MEGQARPYWPGQGQTDLSSRLPSHDTEPVGHAGPAKLEPPQGPTPLGHLCSCRCSAGWPGCVWTRNWVSHPASGFPGSVAPVGVRTLPSSLLPSAAPPGPGLTQKQQLQLASVPPLLFQEDLVDLLVNPGGCLLILRQAPGATAPGQGPGHDLGPQKAQGSMAPVPWGGHPHPVSSRGGLPAAKREGAALFLGVTPQNPQLPGLRHPGSPARRGLSARH